MARLARAGGGRASRSRDRDQRHSGHSLVPRLHAWTFTSARSLHPPTITTRMGSGVNHNYSELFFHV